LISFQKLLSKFELQTWVAAYLPLFTVS